MLTPDQINFAANLTQFYNLFLLLKDATNSELMTELDHQNKDYLEKILDKLNIMEEQLNRLEKNDRF